MGKGIRVVGAGVGKDEDPTRLPEPRERQAGHVIGSGGTAERPASRGAMASRARGAARPKPASTVRATPAKTTEPETAPERRAEKAWSGRLGERTARRVEEFTSSMDVDRRLYPEDIAGSRAHARMLRRIGVLDAEAWRAVDTGLREVRREL